MKSKKVTIKIVKEFCVSDFFFFSSIEVCYNCFETEVKPARANGTLNVCYYCSDKKNIIKYEMDSEERCWVCVFVLQVEKKKNLMI